MVNLPPSPGEALRPLQAALSSIMENKLKGISVEALSDAYQTRLIGALVGFRLWKVNDDAISNPVDNFCPPPCAKKAWRSAQKHLPVAISWEQKPPQTTATATSNIQPLARSKAFAEFLFSATNLHGLRFYFIFLCSSSSLAPKHVWLVLLLLKSSAGLLFVGRRRVARVQLARLPQLVCRCSGTTGRAWTRRNDSCESELWVIQQKSDTSGHLLPWHLASTKLESFQHVERVNFFFYKLGLTQEIFSWTQLTL